MNLKAGVVIGVSLAFAISLCSIPAVADSTADPCTDTEAACTASVPRCQSATSPCVVNLKFNPPSGVSVMVNGQSAPLFCVQHGNAVKWTTDPGMSYTVTFRATHKPFANAVITGSASSPHSEKISPAALPPPAQACFVYSVDVTGPGGKHGTADPKVVVTGP